jgi:Flp pilus assembly protein TadD
VLPLLFVGACSGGGDDKGDGAGKGSASTSPSTAADGKGAVSALLATGLQQVQDTQYSQATATFKKVLGVDPKNVYATYNLGYVAQLQGDDVTALQRYTAALATDKTFAPALYNLAILTEPSDLRAAVSLYRRDIAVKPDDAPAYMRLGFALKHLGQDEEAAQLLQRGVQLDPSLAGVAPPTYQ